MTAAERMRRHRAKKREASSEQAMPGHATALTHKQQARVMGCSERHWYTIQAYVRHQAFEWDGDILDGKYGRCGMSFIAEVCRLGGPEAQRFIHDLIKEKGAAQGRKWWRILKRDAGL